MFRVSVILSVLFIVGISAKPWNKHENEDVKKTIVAIDENGRLSWEVEPPEDMHHIQYEIDPRMKSWKDIPDTDPAADDRPESQKHYISIEYRQNDQPESQKHYISIEYGQKAEEDRDDIDRPVHVEVSAEDHESPVEEEAVSSKTEERIHLHPEEDMDALYHKEVLVPAFYQEDTEVAAPVHLPSQRKYSEPEVDLDHIYHK